MFSLVPFLTYIFLTAYTPGPNNILSMSNASRYGFRKSLPFSFGILTGFFAVMALCTLFTAALFRMVPAVSRFMAVAGAGYMLYLAWTTWRSTSHGPTARAERSSFVSGMLLQFVNPKIMIYAITAMSSYILPHYATLPAVAGFVLLLTLVGFSGALCWSAFGAAFFRLFSQHARIMNGIMAVLLVYCAASLLV